MTESKNTETLTLTQKHAVIFTDLVCGVPVKHTVEEVGLSKTQVINVRNKCKKFMRKDFDHNTLRKKVLGLAPLVIKNMTQLLLEGDKEVTLKCWEGFGFFFKNHDDFMEMLATIGGRGGANVTVVNNIGRGEGDGQSEVDQDDADMRAIFSSCNNSRLAPNSN